MTNVRLRHSIAPRRGFGGGLVIVLTLAALLVAACGGSDSTSAPTATTAAPTATTAPQPTATTAPTATTSAADQAADIELAIEPSSGSYGDGFAYTVSGLTPDQKYVVVITKPDGFFDSMDVWADETGSGLLIEDQMTFQKGPLNEIWFSMAPEPLGEYVVELRAEDGETVLATATFRIVEAGATLDPESNIELAVEPDTGTYGDRFDLVVSGLEPEQQYALVIRQPDDFEYWNDVWANETGDGLLYEDERSGDKMPIPFLWQSEEVEPAGEYVVELRAEDGETVLATASFTIIAAEATPSPVAAEPEISIGQFASSDGTLVTPTFENLVPDDEYIVVLLAPDGSDDRTGKNIADAGGTRLLAAEAGEHNAIGDPFEGWIIEDGDPTGYYRVELRAGDGETVLAEAGFYILEPVVDSGIELRMSPTSGPRNTDFLFITSIPDDFDPEAIVELSIRYPDGREDLEKARYDPARMQLIITEGIYRNAALEAWYVPLNDPLGEYIVELRDPDTGAVLARATFVVE